MHTSPGSTFAERGADQTRFHRQVHAEQVALLYRNAPPAYAITLVNGAILAFMQRGNVAYPQLFAWYGALVCVTVLRAWLVRRYHAAHPPAEAALRWNAAYVAGAALAGSVWGTTAYVMVPSSSVAHEVFVAFVLAGMSAGSITILAFRMEACMAFLLPTLVPLVFRYLTLNSPLHMAMGVMTSIFMVAMVISALTFNRSVRTQLVLRYDKRALEKEIRGREHAEQALLLERDRLKTVLSSIGEGVALVDAHGRIEYLNAVAEKICGKTTDEARGRPASHVFQSFDRHLQTRTTTAMEDSLRAAGQIMKQTVMLFHGSDRRVIEEVATPLYDQQQRVAGAVSIMRDVTDVLQREQELAYAADHDGLTGLPNRNLLQNRLQQAIARAQRRQEAFALLFLDLDRFKEVNDTLGHAAGDALLIEVASRLSHAVREEDTIARLGGDEFVVLLEGPTQEQHVTAVAEKIRLTLGDPYQLESQQVTISVSIGTSYFPTDGADPDTLLGHADAGMYRAKRG